MPVPIRHYQCDIVQTQTKILIGNNQTGWIPKLCVGEVASFGHFIIDVECVVARERFFVAIVVPYIPGYIPSIRQTNHISRRTQDRSESETFKSVRAIGRCSICQKLCIPDNLTLGIHLDKGCTKRGISKVANSVSIRKTIGIGPSSTIVC